MTNNDSTPLTTTPPLNLTLADWQAAHEQMLEADRERLGPPPTNEECDAYFAGSLSPSEEDRVRHLLIAYPELARICVAEYPEGEAQLGEPGYCSDADVEAALQDFQRWRDARHGGARVGYVLLLAVIAILVAVLIWSNRPRSTPDLDVTFQSITPGARRGAPPFFTEIEPAARHVMLLETMLDRQPLYPDYRIDIIRIDDVQYADRPRTKRLVWSGSGLRRTDLLRCVLCFAVLTPKEFWQRHEGPEPDGAYAPGEVLYEIEIYGVNGSRSTILNTFFVSWPRARRSI